MADKLARHEIVEWASARTHWERAAEFLDLARGTSNPDVRNRYVTIAQHYRILAESE
jgi:hypothetical protein